MSDTTPTPTNDDPKNQQDPAHDTEQDHDQDSEATMTAPSDERPDGIDDATGGDDASS